MEKTFERYLSLPHSNTAFVDIVREMRLFPDWASSYLCLYILRNTEMSPVDLIVNSNFSSFFLSSPVKVLHLFQHYT